MKYLPMVFFAYLAVVGCDRSDHHSTAETLPGKVVATKKPEPSNKDWLRFSQARSSLATAEISVDLYTAMKGGQYTSAEMKLRAERSINENESKIPDLEREYDESLAALQNSLGAEKKNWLAMEISQERDLYALTESRKQAESESRTLRYNVPKDVEERAAQKLLDAEDAEKAARETLAELRGKLSPFLWGSGLKKDALGDLLRRANAEGRHTSASN